MPGRYISIVATQRCFFDLVKLFPGLRGQIMAPWSMTPKSGSPFSDDIMLAVVKTRQIWNIGPDRGAIPSR
ncbi:hypothetical protein MPC4_40122 [Methylocella tundrae]|uniref:Uncharacterized protein n=1 Tax=Methylocella tundrae TaxID=227605 RepID=A0A8B6MAH6_METTU|nr:hypothetical protein MPC1_4750003 [Methylocella tundrae]VTZ51525.1 hypothetical protein MPC4_40122 [Methylocella tundrae]